MERNTAGKGAPRHIAVGQHIADAGRHAQIVFQHHKVAGFVADQIAAADIDIGAVRHRQSAHLAPVMLGAVNHRARQHAVLQHPPVIVDVAQEQVQGMNALGQAAFDPVPFGRGDDARQKVGGNDPLGRLIVVIDREGDALMQKALLASLLAAIEFLQRQGGNARVHHRIRQARLAVAAEHLVIRLAQLIICVRRIDAGAGNPAGTGDDIRAAKVFSVGEGLLLHARSLHGWRASSQALLLFSSVASPATDSPIGISA
jgi:hypothetical protein